MMSEARIAPPEGLQDAEPYPEGYPGGPDPLLEPEPGGWTPVGSQEEVDRAIGTDQPPRAPLPPSGETTLPGGYIDGDGLLHQTARVRELTGEDEEALASFDPNKDIAQYITQVVARGVQSVGPHAMTPELSRKLLMGDRDALMLAIRKVTFGQEVPLQIRCVDCDALSDVLFDVDEDFHTKKLLNPKERLFSVALRNGRKASLVLPTGAVHERIVAFKGSSAEANTLMMSMCVKNIDGDDVVTEERIKALGMADRQTLLNFVVENQPGPDLFNLKAPCHRCGRQYPVVISLGVLFR